MSDIHRTVPVPAHDEPPDGPRRARGPDGTSPAGQVLGTAAAAATAHNAATAKGAATALVHLLMEQLVFGPPGADPAAPDLDECAGLRPPHVPVPPPAGVPVPEPTDRDRMCAAVARAGARKTVPDAGAGYQAATGMVLMNEILRQVTGARTGLPGGAAERGPRNERVSPRAGHVDEDVRWK
jgi:hypothetical protein